MRRGFSAPAGQGSPLVCFHLPFGFGVGGSVTLGNQCSAREAAGMGPGAGKEARPGSGRPGVWSFCLAWSAQPCRSPARKPGKGGTLSLSLPAPRKRGAAPVRIHGLFLFYGISGRSLDLSSGSPRGGSRREGMQGIPAPSGLAGVVQAPRVLCGSGGPAIPVRPGLTGEGAGDSLGWDSRQPPTTTPGVGAEKG